MVSLMTTMHPDSAVVALTVDMRGYKGLCPIADAATFVNAWWAQMVSQRGGIADLFD